VYAPAPVRQRHQQHTQQRQPRRQQPRKGWHVRMYRSKERRGLHRRQSGTQQQECPAEEPRSWSGLSGHMEGGEGLLAREATPVDGHGTFARSPPPPVATPASPPPPDGCRWYPPLSPLRRWCACWSNYSRQVRRRAGTAVLRLARESKKREVRAHAYSSVPGRVGE